MQEKTKTIRTAHGAAGPSETLQLRKRYKALVKCFSTQLRENPKWQMASSVGAVASSCGNRILKTSTHGIYANITADTLAGKQQNIYANDALSAFYTIAVSNHHGS